MLKALVKKESNKAKPFEPRRHIPKGRTAEPHRVLFTRPVQSDNKRAEANYMGQQLAWNIASKHTFHLHENVQFIVDALNTAFSDGREKIIGNSVHHSKFSLWTRSRKYTFDLKLGEIDKELFLAEIAELVEAD